ncbi:hypothetical protein FXN63_19130 [Pigmentiphaga aceris]|uniref:Uncharacterized protein n=1 Tax=Pigmentiphaga aceris TaxID=1940612 RepID=A0A5C0B160_9BURK|nr:hypothetical protein [Pigmentiphaga aceris]QEI07716.1 hypothetical protein FXN63_19130 [Pigmentiphaga aceris]
MSHLAPPARSTKAARASATSADRAETRPEIDVMAKALAAAVRSVPRADQRLVLDKLRAELKLDGDSTIKLPATRHADDEADDIAAESAPLSEQTYARRRALVDKGELLTSADLIARVDITRQALSNRLAAGSIFYVDGGRNERYYPAFFADATLDTKAVRKVTKALGNLPGASKWLFFTSPRESLGDLTPLDVLAGKRPAAKPGYAAGELERIGLDTVLRAAAAAAEA